MHVIRRLLALTIVVVFCVILAGCGASNNVTLNLAVTGQGTTDPVPGAHDYAKNTVVTLTAVPADGWAFSGWTGGATGTDNPLDLTMDGDKSVTATFIQLKYDLTTSVEPEVGAGSVMATLVETADRDYTYGQTVSLQATANEGWVFDHWTGNLTGADNPQTLVMDEAKTVTAVFVKVQHTLAVAVTGSGTVTKEPDKTSYDYGESVTLTATPSEGWTFSGWSGDLTGGTNPAILIMNGDKSVTATFTQLVYDLTISVEPDSSVGGVTATLVKVKGKGYTHGQTVSLEATAINGWVFDHWEGNVTGSTNPQTLVMDGPKAVTAYFVPVLKGRVIGAQSHSPIAGVTVSFSDGGTAVTDDNGVWMKKYAPGAAPEGGVTVSIVLDGFILENHTPSSVTLAWPAEDTLFYFEGFRFLAKWGTNGSGDGQFSCPYGVAVDAAGNVYVADSHNCRIQKFTSGGAFLAKWGTNGSGDGQFSIPNNVAVDAAGTV